HRRDAANDVIGLRLDLALLFLLAAQFVLVAGNGARRQRQGQTSGDIPWQAMVGPHEIPPNSSCNGPMPRIAVSVYTTGVNGLSPALPIKYTGILQAGHEETSGN